MPGEFGHEALAKLHYFPIGLSLGIEIRTAFSTSQRKSGQAVLEYLFEAQKLQDAEVYRRVKSQSAFVGTDCRVEFDSVPSIDLYIPLIVCPGHPEHDDPLRLNHAP